MSLAWLLLATLVLPPNDGGPPGAAPCSGRIEGVVVDGAGRAVPGASVEGRANGWAGAQTTDAEGRFVLAGGPEGELRVMAELAGRRGEVAVASRCSAATEVRVVLDAPRFSEQVTVTAGADPGLRSPASVTVLSSSDLLSSAAANVDDALRSVPTFSLFRRASSRTANPTSQGVTLRGVGASGASRALVVVDGLALNDPFGGWVYWDRVPVVSVDQVEVVRGGRSDTLGADAVGGVIRLQMIRPRRLGLRASVEGGQAPTRRLSLFAGDSPGPWRWSVSGESSRDAGSGIVAPAARGPVDTRAGANYDSAWFEGGRDLSSSWRLDGRANLFDERRRNGTPLQTNATRLGVGSVGLSGAIAGGTLVAATFVERQRYWQSFSSIASDRRSESLVREQRVPARSAGARVSWRRPIGVHAVAGGVEFKRTEATTNERIYQAGGAPPRAASAGGYQDAAAASLQASVVLAPTVLVNAGVRADAVRVAPTGEPAPARPFDAWSPRVSALWQVRPAVALSASVSRSFRAPTLNELYRGFRLGSVVTNANQGLDPERATGVEVGVSLGGRRARVRLVVHRDTLDAAITNVTLQSAPDLIVRQRRNAGRIRANGLEIEASLQPTATLLVGLSADAGTSRFVSDGQGLRGSLVPQVARYHAAANVRYAVKRLVVSADVRLLGPQYEDDLNLFLLRRTVLADAFGSVALARPLTLFVAVENVFDTEYDVGRTPIPTIGLPRTVRVGLRVIVP